MPRPNGLFAALTSRRLGCLTPPSSLLTPHPSPLIPHSYGLTPHSSLLTPTASFLTPTASLLTPHPRQKQPQHAAKETALTTAQTTAPINPIHQLLKRLRAAGLPESFARRALPSWWDDEIALNPSGLQQAQLYFARAFHIDLPSLALAQGAVQFQASRHKFKLSRNVAESDVTLSAHYATAMAHVALVGASLGQTQVPKDPLALRNGILQTHHCVDLPALLAWCSEAHIPVLHIHQLPGNKMTGLVVQKDGRFAIVLCKKGSPSHLLFHLAHELGHIANGHLQGNDFVVDQNIGSSDAGDADEKEADAYAIRLLNGSYARYSPGPGSRIRNGAALYKAALVKANQERIDVGHIILNYGNTQNAHPLANAAIKLIPGEADGIKLVNKAFFQFLDDEKLSGDQLELLKTATAYSA